MRSPEHSDQEVADLLDTAYEAGIDFFDNATCIPMVKLKNVLARL